MLAVTPSLFPLFCAFAVHQPASTMILWAWCRASSFTELLFVEAQPSVCVQLRALSWLSRPFTYHTLVFQPESSRGFRSGASLVGRELHASVWFYFLVPPSTSSSTPHGVAVRTFESHPIRLRWYQMACLLLKLLLLYLGPASVSTR